MTIYFCIKIYSLNVTGYLVTSVCLPDCIMYVREGREGGLYKAGAGPFLSPK